MRTAAAICLVALVVLAGCGGTGSTPSPSAAGTPATPTPSVAPPAGTATPTPTPSPTPSATPTPTGPPDLGANGRADPETDVVGWEQGYWHNESIAVDNADGLDDSEFAAVKSRMMARVELIRQREFRRTVTFEFMTRETFRERNSFQFGERPRREQLWEAAFVVGENASTAAALSALYAVVVDGYTRRRGDEARIVTIHANPDQPRIDPLVLSHELSHAMSGVSRERPLDRPLTTDERLAWRSEEEGQASWVDTRYERLCGTKWDCIRRPEGAEQVPSQDVNMGLYLQFAAPYTLGQNLQDYVYRHDGVAGVKQVQRVPPRSMEQVIHPGAYLSDAPTEVSVNDSAGEGWRRVSSVDAELGEAVLYIMLRQNGVVETDPVDVTVDQQTGLDFDHPATAGWDGDAVASYTNGSAYGYVFKSVWDGETDARQFREAYLAVLRHNGAERVGANTWVIDDGPYADAFRVVRSGDTLVVVNAPTVAALDDVHATNATA